MFSVFHKIIRAALIVTPIVFFGWLIYKDVAPSGRITAIYDMRRETPFVSKLYPADRVSEAKQDAGGKFYREILAEPVYFDLKPNGQFEKAAVTVRYNNSGTAPVKIGGLVNKAAWTFDWRDLPPTGGQWTSQTEIFDFTKIIPEGRKYRLGFSAIGVRPGEIEIGEIKILFVRPELDGRGVANRIIDGIIWRVNNIF